MSQESPVKFIDLRQEEGGSGWITVNDVVMGGVSSSNAEKIEGGLLFRGNVSLDNNGGFSSVRKKFSSLDLSGYNGFIITLTGDGKSYGISLTDRLNFSGLYYNKRFETGKNEKQILKFNFNHFIPLYFGRPMKDTPPLNLSSIKEISFIISDKQAGAFSLLIEKIELYKD